MFSSISKLATGKPPRSPLEEPLLGASNGPPSVRVAPTTHRRSSAWDATPEKPKASGRQDLKASTPPAGKNAYRVTDLDVLRQGDQVAIHQLFPTLLADAKEVTFAGTYMGRMEVTQDAGTFEFHLLANCDEATAKRIKDLPDYFSKSQEVRRARDHAQLDSGALAIPVRRSDKLDLVDPPIPSFNQLAEQVQAAAAQKRQLRASVRYHDGIFSATITAVAAHRTVEVRPDVGHVSALGDRSWARGGLNSAGTEWTYRIKYTPERVRLVPGYRQLERSPASISTAPLGLRNTQWRVVDVAPVLKKRGATSCATAWIEGEEYAIVTFKDSKGHEGLPELGMMSSDGTVACTPWTQAGMRLEQRFGSYARSNVKAECHLYRLPQPAGQATPPRESKVREPATVDKEASQKGGSKARESESDSSARLRSDAA